MVVELNETVRDVVFISHATPEDNDFVRWLGARLIGLGYNVWADVFELKGGTPFWRSIEEAIRQRAVKVIYVASTASVDPARSGVRNEVMAASVMGSKLEDAQFIIPVRRDKVDFGLFPIQVSQLNAIDFSVGWGGKLLELVDTLETAKVPVDPSRIDERMAFWKERTSREPPTVAHEPELLVANLLPVAALPAAVNIYEFSGPNTEIKDALQATGIPYRQFQRLIISFADVDELQAGLPSRFRLSLERSVPLERFLAGPDRDETAPFRSDARGMISHLMRWHVERFLLSKGLKAYEAPGGRAFYFPLGLIADAKVRYATPDGKRTWKGVVGRSEKYRVNWHLSMQVNIDLGPPAFVRFKPYICFSEDGKDPITEPKRTTALRRRICKTWWNRQWRQLQQAFVAFLSGGGAEFTVSLDGTAAMTLSGSLLQLQGARRLVGDIELADMPEEPADDEDDEGDEDFDFVEPYTDEEDAA